MAERRTILFSELTRNALYTALGFSWPVLLGYAAKGTFTPFQVYVGTSISGLAYFALLAMYGGTEVGTISVKSMAIILVCGVAAAFGFERYIKILPSPMHIGIALALTQVLVVFGCTILHEGGWKAITCYKMTGLALISLGIFFINLK